MKFKTTKKEIKKGYYTFSNVAIVIFKTFSTVKARKHILAAFMVGILIYTILTA
jgi:hypothetical protein